MDADEAQTRVSIPLQRMCMRGPCALQGYMHAVRLTWALRWQVCGALQWQTCASCMAFVMTGAAFDKSAKRLGHLLAWRGMHVEMPVWLTTLHTCCCWCLRLLLVDTASKECVDVFGHAVSDRLLL